MEQLIDSILSLDVSGSPTITQTFVNVCSALCETMTSVYFPAHVFILFRRLLNVVSTLSISNHYISYSRQG